MTTKHSENDARTVRDPENSDRPRGSYRMRALLEEASGLSAVFAGILTVVILEELLEGLTLGEDVFWVVDGSTLAIVVVFPVLLYGLLAAVVTLERLVGRYEQ